MELEVDPISTNFSNCRDWALKTGIWDGRIIFQEEFPDFSKEIGSISFIFLLSITLLWIFMLRVSQKLELLLMKLIEKKTS